VEKHTNAPKGKNKGRMGRQLMIEGICHQLEVKTLKQKALRKQKTHKTAETGGETTDW